MIDQDEPPLPQEVNLLADLTCDWRRYCTEGRQPLFAEGFWVILVYRLGRSVYLIKNRLMRTSCLLPLLIIRKVVGIIFGITIPFTVRIGPGLFVPHFGGIIVHDDSVLGRECSIYQGVTLGAKGSKRGGPILGDGVNVGAGAVILGPVVIGDRVDVGANAVVLADVPPDSIAVGIPAVAKPKRLVDRNRVFA